MRILFTGVVGFGHFNPMVPLARAFVDAGHEVRFAIDPGFCPTVEATGFTAFPAGLDHREALARFRATMPGWDAIPPADRAIHLVPGMFGRVRVPPMLADLGPIIERWRPGLLIHDSAELAGGIAAEVAGIPHVEHSFGLLRPLAIRQAATDVLGPLSAAAGVRNPGMGGLGDEPYLDICPPRLQFADIAALPTSSGSDPWRSRSPPIPRSTPGSPAGTGDRCRLSDAGHRLQRCGPRPVDPRAIDGGRRRHRGHARARVATRRSSATGRDTSTSRRSSRRRRSSGGRG